MPTKNELLAMINSKVDFFGYLYSRWMDEREYEDFAEYVRAVQTHFSTCTSGKRRPFMFTIHCIEGKVEVHITSRYIKTLFYAKVPGKQEYAGGSK